MDSLSSTFTESLIFSFDSKKSIKDDLTSTNPKSPYRVNAFDSLFRKSKWDSALSFVGSGQDNYLKNNNSKRLMVKKPRKRMDKLYVKDASHYDSTDIPVYPKTDDDANFLRKNVLTEFLLSRFNDTDTSKALDEIIGAFEKVEVSKEEVIIRQGDDGDSFYIIETGSVRFEIDGNEVGLAGPGESFGALSLLYNNPRAASCIANESCKLWRVIRKVFMRVVSNTKNESLGQKKAMLRRVPFFSELDDEFLTRLVESSVEQSFSKNEMIIKKGEVGEIFYVLIKGKVLVHDIGSEESKCTDSELGPGSYFGERSIISESPTNANVTAAEDCKVMAFSGKICQTLKKYFREIVVKSNYSRMLTGIFGHGTDFKVSDSDIKTLCKMIKEVSLKSKTHIHNVESMPKRGLYFVLNGVVESTTIGKSKLHKTADFFGYHTLFSEQFSIKAEVIEDCKLGVLKSKDIESVCSNLVKSGNALISQTRKESMNKSFPFNALHIHEVLGEGAFGKVWLTSSLKDDKKISNYALKELSKRHMIDKDYVSMIKREVEVLSDLDHQFIIKMLNVYQNGSSVFILFPLMPGGELMHLIEEYYCFSENATKFYGAIILEALSYLHKRNIIYRDLKPENILIDKDGYCVLVDFGFAKEVTDKTFTMCGTPLYMAPETILNKGQKSGVDLWAWGVILYEMIVGEHPFHQEERVIMRQIFRKICRGKFYIPDDADIDEDLADLFSQVFEVKKSQRIGFINGWDEIREHSWYNDYDFSALLLRQHKAPWKPAYLDLLKVQQLSKQESQVSLCDYNTKDEILTDEQVIFECFGEYYV